jgi:predicted enzyme related to lactoylglutathione lyase
MPEVTEPYAPGTPCWIDVMVPDQQAALDFYRDLFGWQGEVGPEEFGGYAVCTQRGRPVAGIMRAMAASGEEPPQPSWTTYFASGDIGSTESRIVDEGGALLVPPMQVAELGWMMVAADPQGAVFGLWQAKEFPGAGIVNEHGALIWNQLITTEVTDAGYFYHGALGMEPRQLGGLPGFTGFRVRERTIAGVQDMRNMEPGTPPHWLVHFAVDDVDSSVDAVVRAGGTLRVPPFDLERIGRLSVVEDPQRALFAMIAPVGRTA